MPSLQGVHALVEAPGAQEYVPTGQLLHVADEFAPATVENVPATHAVHTVERGAEL
jgi:hypothetical protein